MLKVARVPPLSVPSRTAAIIPVLGIGLSDLFKQPVGLCWLLV